MLTIGYPTPMIGCNAVIKNEVVPLEWGQLHSGKTLVLQFDSLESETDHLVALSEAFEEFDRARAKVAVVCRDHMFECLQWAGRSPEEGGAGDPRFPIIIDSDNEIASIYDMQAVDGRTLWGHVIIDASGKLRQIAISSIQLAVSVGELLRCIAAIDNKKGKPI